MSEELSPSPTPSREESGPSTSPVPSQKESEPSSGTGRTRPKRGSGSRTYANFRSAIASIWTYRRSSLLAISGVFVGALVVMTTDIVVQSTDTLFSLHLYAQVIAILLVSIGGVSFAAGGLILMNVFLAAGIERSQEFSIRLVVGARHRDIHAQLLFEVLLLSIIGGVSGSVCGILTGFALTVALSLPCIVHPVSLLLLVSTSVVAGIVGGIYPAARTARREL